MSTMSKSERVHKSATTETVRHDPNFSDTPSRERNNAKNQAAAAHTARRTCLLRSILLCLAIVGICIARYPNFIDHNAHIKGEIEVKFDVANTGPLNPERDKLQGVNHFYILPPINATNNEKPKGVLVYLHSCKQSGFDFFTLPEHRIVANAAIQKGLVVFAPTSQNRESGCYTLEDANGYLEKVVSKFLRTHRLHRLPIVGLGYSSGGAFLSLIHKTLKLESMAIYNSPQGYGDMLSKYDSFIPTVYLSMSNDISLSNEMDGHKNLLQEKNISTHLYKVAPIPFTQSLCAARLPEITNGFCEHIFETIERDHSSLLDADGFVLDEDVKSKPWRRLIKNLESDCENNHPTVASKSQILCDGKAKSSPGATRSWLRVILEQEIKTCYGFHAMTAQFHDDIINFLISNSKMKENPP